MPCLKTGHLNFISMIKGNKVNDISVDDVLQFTNGGYDIYRYYLGYVGRIMQRPWGRKEKKLSWGIFTKNNIWFWKDHANGEVGNAIHFVERYFGLSFKDAKSKICFDFGIGGTKINVNPVNVTWERPVNKEEYSDIGVITRPFEKKHHKFWNAAEVTEDHCKDYNCFAVRKLSINRRFVPLKPDEIVFAYYAEEEQGWKIYFPERPTAKFKNNVSGHYLWNYNNLKECDDLIIQKSMKDLIVTTLLTPCVIATQNESSGIFDAEMVKKINTITRTPWVWYGSDWDGVKKCKKITDTNKWKYINTPKDLLPDINDAYGYVKRFGLKSLEDFMKSKKLLK